MWSSRRKILQPDAEPLAHVRNLILAEQRDVLAEQVDEAACRPNRQKQQPQQRGLAGARGTGEKLEGMRRNQESKVAQNLRAEPVPQTDIFEPNHAQLRSTWAVAELCSAWAVAGLRPTWIVAELRPAWLVAELRSAWAAAANPGFGP